MAGVFTVGALAVAAERANAVGAVRLSCLPAALEIELLRIAAYSPSYAPGALARAVRLEVPYAAVRGLVRRGRVLCLALDPAVVTPHNRFALTSFCEDPNAALATALAARRNAAIASYVVPPLFGAVAMWAVPEALASGALGVFAVGLLTALGAHALLRELSDWLTWGGPLSDRYGEAFELELSRRLGLSPARVSTLAPPDEPLSVAPSPAAPLWPMLAAAAVAAVALVGAIGVVRRPAAQTEPERRESARSALAAALQRSVTAARAEVARHGPPCTCARADSPLWKDGVPILSVLPLSRDDGSLVGPRQPEGSGVRRYDLDVAAVNNGAVPLEGVQIVLTFARRDAAGRRVGAHDRGLFWGGELGPGQAVKWHVRGRGTEMRIDTNVAGTLDAAGLEPAPPDAFAELASARLRGVRAHAAAMLAHLGDPRARQAVAALSAEASGDPTVARIARAAAPVLACEAAVTAGMLQACVFNASARPASGLELRELGAGGIERRWPLDLTVPVHEGVRVAVPLAGRAELGELEVAAAGDDRAPGADQAMPRP